MNPEKSHHKPSSHIIVKKERGISTLAVQQRRGPSWASRVPKTVVMCGPRTVCAARWVGGGDPHSLSSWESLNRLLHALLQRQSVLVCPQAVQLSPAT